MTGRRVPAYSFPKPRSPRAPGLFAFPGVIVDPDAYLTRAQAVMLTGVPSSTIAHWRARGWLTPDGERRHLRTRAGVRSWLEYRLGDLIDAERHTRASRNSPRNWRRGRAEEQGVAA